MLKINNLKHGFVVFWISVFLISVETHSQRRLSEEAEIFNRVRASVFSITGYEGRGSGFLIDSGGLVLTNHHVVKGSKRILVDINDSLRVEGKILVEDAVRDAAILILNPSSIRNLEPMSLRLDSGDIAFEGEEILAIGFPLHQSRILTTGVVSKVEQTALISDVNINHGSSGGPLLNLDGQVIGITTFGDFSDQGGPGVSGIVRIDHVAGLIKQARILLANATYQSDMSLPMMTRVSVAESLLDSVSSDKLFPIKYYQKKTSRFQIEIETPVYKRAQERIAYDRLTRKRKKRERKGSTTAEESVDRVKQTRDWYQYVNSPYPPVLQISVYPVIGETKGSFWGNFLGEVVAGAANSYYRGSHDLEFKGDLKDFILLRNSEPVTEIFRGTSFVTMDYYSATWGGDYSGTDVALCGQFFYEPDVFKPVDSVLPKISFVVYRIEKPNKPDTLLLPEWSVKQVWSDFEKILKVPTDSIAIDSISANSQPIDSLSMDTLSIDSLIVDSLPIDSI